MSSNAELVEKREDENDEDAVKEATERVAIEIMYEGKNRMPYLPNSVNKTKSMMT